VLYFRVFLSPIRLTAASASGCSLESSALRCPRGVLPERQVGDAVNTRLQLSAVLIQPRRVEADLFIAALGSVVLWLLSGEWLTVLGLWTLWAGWRYLRTPKAPDVAPVLPLAFTFQWVQVTAGIYYYAVTGRQLEAIDGSDYRPMVLIGLGCLLALLLGLSVGMRLIRRPRPMDEAASFYAFRWSTVIALYVASVAVTGAVRELAWEVPSLTQGLLALTYARFALLFLVFRRLSQPRVRAGWFS
jgi:hypothetical protein